MAMASAMRWTSAAGPRRLRGLLYWKFTSVLPFNPNPPKPDKSSTESPAEPYTNLFVEGLHKRTTSKGLRTAFSKFGKVVEAKVVRDPSTGYSKGYGFVKYASMAEAIAGQEGMNGCRFRDGRVIFAEFARPGRFLYTFSNVDEEFVLYGMLCN